MAVLGGRNNYCINSAALNAEEDIDRAWYQIHVWQKSKFSKQAIMHDRWNPAVTSTKYFTPRFELFNNFKVGALAANHKFEPGRQSSVWDIEDMKSIAKKQRGCPYYAARTLAETSHIVFCPYNYVLEPSNFDHGKVRF